ncbi:MAG: site-specific DNA-methyltransferase [Desulfobacteraceae bacterium]|nr:site-specific DNA-methyltransferase [Desulfobacteraceae bacterium]
MPTLDWIGKKAVVNHHKEVPFHLLKCDPELSVGEPESENLIVQGDNLLALKALLPYYARQVKCIYIDPPYNTGNEKWIYNDNVNSPEIKEWLGRVVGAQSEDLSRHDKWLCMMYPRLVLLKQLLSEDGAIFVSIDDNEVASLRLLMNDIFGQNNFITSIAWQKIYTLKNSARHFSEMHDYIIVYALNKKKWERNLLPRRLKTQEDYSNPDNDHRGVWTTNALQSRNYYSKGVYSIICPGGDKIEGPPKGTYWRMEENKLWELNNDNRVWWGLTGNNSPRIKKFLLEAKDGVVPSTWWLHKFAGTNSGAKTELRSILGELEEELFNTPKPWQLIQRILQIATDRDSIVLDSFAGSGATAQAVFEQNAKDGGNRKCILVELDENVAKNITARRVRNIIEGYPFKGKKREELYNVVLNLRNLKNIPEYIKEIEDIEKSNKENYTNIKKEFKNNELKVYGEHQVKEKMPGLGGSIKYCNIDSPLFDSTGQITKSVSFIDLARFVFFKETGSPLTDDISGKSPLISIHNGTAVYLLYNGVLGDKTPQGGNAITRAVLVDLPPYDGPKIVYGTSCRIGLTRLKQENIIFRQIPYELKVD